MGIYSIYKATNKITNEVYIGQSKNAENRIVSHHRTAKNIEKKPNSKLYAAAREYGWDFFEWEILYQSKDQIHIRLMETYFIMKYDAVKNGYNLMPGMSKQLVKYYLERDTQENILVNKLLSENIV